MIRRRSALACVALAAATAFASPARAASNIAATAPIAPATAVTDTVLADTALTTVILVRHAERSATWLGADPPLDPKGVARAKTLARVLGDANVAGIYITTFRRNRETAEPLATALGDSMSVLVGDDFAAQAARIQREAHGKTALVVGHSDTVPQLVLALTGKTVPPFRAGEFDWMYVVTIRPGGSQVLRLHYGDPSPAP